MVVVIEDELHAELQGEFACFEDAVAELKHRSHLAWDESPNRAPCVGWKTCGRKYEVIEYNNDFSPWRELRRVLVLEVSASGITWPTG
jgi:hypothetical protein